MRASPLLFGNGNILANSTVSGFSTPLPTSSGGTSVTMKINGMACPLVYVSRTQINLQAPTARAARTASVMVNNNGQTFSTTVQVLTAAPGIFTSDYMVTAILQDGNGAVPNQSKPGQPGADGRHVTLRESDRSRTIRATANRLPSDRWRNPLQVTRPR